MSLQKIIPEIEESILFKVKEYSFQNLTDIITANSNKKSLLFFVASCNFSQKLNFTPEELTYLITHNDLNFKSIGGIIPLLECIWNNARQNLNLTQSNWNYLFKHSDLYYSNNLNLTALTSIISSNYLNNINLNEENWKYLINNSDVSIVEKNKDLYLQKNIPQFSKLSPQLIEVNYQAANKGYKTYLSMLEKITLEKALFNINIQSGMVKI